MARATAQKISTNAQTNGFSEGNERKGAIRQFFGRRLLFFNERVSVGAISASNEKPELADSEGKICEVEPKPLFFQFSPIYSNCDGKLRGAKVTGLMGVCEKDAKGVVISGIASGCEGNVDGFEGGGVGSISRGKVRGVLGAILLAANEKEIRGWEWGAIAVAYVIRGVQTALAAEAIKLSGVQAPFVNWADEAIGSVVQFLGFNRVGIAKKDCKVKQFGFVNIVRAIEEGAKVLQFGVLSRRINTWKLFGIRIWTVKPKATEANAGEMESPEAGAVDIDRKPKLGSALLWPEAEFD